MSRIARRLGGRATRRRRHRRFALGAAVLLGLAGILIVAGAEDGADEDGAVAGPATTAVPADPVERICVENAAEIDTARRALLQDNTAPGAVEGFLADAFVDLARDRSEAIRAVQPPVDPEVLAVLEQFDDVVDSVEADPGTGVGSNPFAAVDERWRALGLGGCAMGGNNVQGDE